MTGAITVVLDESDVVLPDLLSELQDRTQLTRRSIMRIVSGSTRLKDFARNPQQFIDLASEVITRSKRIAIVDGIRYQRLGSGQCYSQELFEEVELTGYLKNMLSDAKKSIYEDVVYDFGVEANFATDLEHNDAVKVYAKLPGWFTVPTPLGSYNPDWAVVVDVEGEERLYFVVETKASLFTDDLRDTESAKIECGKAHFSALADGESPARYIVARSLDDVMANAFQNGG
jgi:type III restriction enzyme